MLRHNDVAPDVKGMPQSRLVDCISEVMAGEIADKKRPAAGNMRMSTHGRATGCSIACRSYGGLGVLSLSRKLSCRLSTARRHTPKQVWGWHDRLLPIRVVMRQLPHLSPFPRIRRLQYSPAPQGDENESADPRRGRAVLSPAFGLLNSSTPLRRRKTDTRDEPNDVGGRFGSSYLPERRLVGRRDNIDAGQPVTPIQDPWDRPVRRFHTGRHWNFHARHGAGIRYRRQREPRRFRTRHSRGPEPAASDPRLAGAKRFPLARNKRRTFAPDTSTAGYGIRLGWGDDRLHRRKPH